MSIGAAATLRFIGAVLQTTADLCYWVGDTAGQLGDPALSTPGLCIFIALWCSGRWVHAVYALLLLTLWDLFQKDFL